MLSNQLRKNIVSLLRSQPGLTYSDFLEEKMDSSKLAYHLNYLKDQNLVMKKDDKYYLTEFGKQEVGYLDGATQEQERQPIQVAITALVKDGKILLTKRKREPFHSIHSCIGGKVKFGESTQQTAERELLEETGLTADLTLKGITHLTSKENGETTYHHNIYIYKGENIKGQLLKETDEGENKWVSLEKLNEINCFTTIPLFVEMVQSNQFRILDIDRLPTTNPNKPYDIEIKKETNLKH
ncbi:MAG: NUDIX domain-containing protein [Candidatus Diapherotrites archaeon]|nr:NUDIX domain-containing protein [Candidatus Diapherotrites archaeon]